MTNKIKLEKQQRLREIEDRKIEILLEITNINDNYSEKESRPNSEYTQLDKEYYQLQLELLEKKQKE